MLGQDACRMQHLTFCQRGAWLAARRENTARCARRQVLPPRRMIYQGWPAHAPRYEREAISGFARARFIRRRRIGAQAPDDIFGVTYIFHDMRQRRAAQRR